MSRLGHRVNVARNLHYHNRSFSKIVLVFRVLWSYRLFRVASLSLGDLPLLIFAMYRSIWSELDT